MGVGVLLFLVACCDFSLLFVAAAAAAVGCVADALSPLISLFNLSLFWLLARTDAGASDKGKGASLATAYTHIE